MQPFLIIVVINKLKVKGSSPVGYDYDSHDRPH